MSNNKQSSVEWLFEQQFNSFEKYNNGEFSFAEYMTHNLKLREQAKEMHKDEVINAVVWFDNTDRRPHLIEIEVEQYYNEKFGGNK